jgi:hypothetical protein
MAGIGLAGALAVAAVPTAAAAKCQTIGAGATAMTVEDAKANATQGLKDLLASTGMKPRGKVSLTCSTTLIVSDCNARQRACK